MSNCWDIHGREFVLVIFNSATILLYEVTYMKTLLANIYRKTLSYQFHVNFYQ